MLGKRFTQHVALLTLVSGILGGCFHPPYNNFKPDNRPLRDGILVTGAGAAVGSIGGFVAGSTLAGTGVGAVAFAAHGLYKTSKPNIIKELHKKHVQFEQYGDTITLIIPTDRYFRFNSPHLNEPCYPGLLLILKLLSFYPHSTIYVAGFTDNIGSRYHKNKLSQAQAETMLGFLWANGVNAQRLDAQGYGEKYAVSDNKIIHGSAQNRRIELQWFNAPLARVQAIPYLGPTK